MTWPSVKSALGRVFMRRRSNETRDREDEWHRADQYNERVRVVETDMRAITTYVNGSPNLKPLPRQDNKGEE